jgi:hypothetical protein
MPRTGSEMKPTKVPMIVEKWFQRPSCLGLFYQSPFQINIRIGLQSVQFDTENLGLYSSYRDPYAILSSIDQTHCLSSHWTVPTVIKHDADLGLMFLARQGFSLAGPARFNLPSTFQASLFVGSLIIICGRLLFPLHLVSSSELHRKQQPI